MRRFLILYAILALVSGTRRPFKRFRGPSRLPTIREDEVGPAPQKRKSPPSHILLSALGGADAPAVPAERRVLMPTGTPNPETQAALRVDGGFFLGELPELTYETSTPEPVAISHAGYRFGRIRRSSKSFDFSELQSVLALSDV